MSGMEPKYNAYGEGIPNLQVKLNSDLVKALNDLATSELEKQVGDERSEAGEEKK